jgi:hypothetical protein
MALETMKFKKSDCDPCCYTRNEDGRLVFYLSWVDDCLFLANYDDVINKVNDMKTYFECDNVGCKINMNKDEGIVTFKQPVLLKH